MFVGQFAWRPNAEAALELVDEILPRLRASVPAARLTLVGPEPPRKLTGRGGDGVTITGSVPSVLPFLRRARVTVIPLRAGGGTRLKVLEALACGVPVVATRLAVDGLAVRDGAHALLADSPAALAERAAQVIEDADLARSLSRAGRELVARHYGWDRVAEPLVELHLELARTAERR